MQQVKQVANQVPQKSRVDSTPTLPGSQSHAPSFIPRVTSHETVLHIDQDLLSIYKLIITER